MTGSKQPQMDEAPAVASGQGFKVQKTANRSNFEANLASRQDMAFATEPAKSALAGWAVQVVDCNSGMVYRVSRVTAAARCQIGRHCADPFGKWGANHER